LQAGQLQAGRAAFEDSIIRKLSWFGTVTVYRIPKCQPSARMDVGSASILFEGSPVFDPESILIVGWITMGRAFEVRKNSMAKTAGQKTKIYSKYGKQLYVAAKNGVPDPASNLVLRSLIEKAKRDQVPAHVIDKAIDKAKGAGGEDFFSCRYEGYGPGSCAVIIDCLTDNNMRTITDVRNCFTKTNSKMGAPGAVIHGFDHLAIFSFKGTDSDAVLEALLSAEADVTDVESEEGVITVFAPAAEFYKVKSALLASFPDITVEVEEISFVPTAQVDISEEDRPMFDKFINMLNECDDVQEVYHNAKL
jgi:YebC/PmpR family DNA-binding regulatory protein